MMPDMTAAQFSASLWEFSASLWDAVLVEPSETHVLTFQPRHGANREAVLMDAAMLAGELAWSGIASYEYDPERRIVTLVMRSTGG